ncbi:3-oxoacyl-[acyl-carrier-protein] synthase 3 protein 4 [Amycolatopsis sp. NBRC 101858]|uniref:beta-ketoacyl-ACP synthase III n=1 Tax=Amycolatopsis sp. NBRC 101858 TaxID=3032200 RepID=UPI0024A073EF|nr:beta-ketoacyl-ACP synthase III [Amycolatopsis sp. NBRC 101858]GLY43449.1 3-oxoacyl-[acyl-carrier-protein] synthase 3 protein 4 [Amycolatopsis sp. NBRC 101858]
MPASAPGSRIVACGHHQPVRSVTNDELSASLGTSDTWITERVGVRTRRLAAPGESVADMATAAAGDALTRSGRGAGEIDLVIVATCTAFDRMPSVAARVADRLGIPAPAVFDLNAACSGFCHALASADHALRAGAGRRAIVVGADKMSDFLDWTDRTTCVIFGDGAGAAVVEATGGPGGIGPVVWGSDPAKGSCISLESAGPHGLPATFRQEGPAVFRWATTELAPIARTACSRAGIDPRDLGGIVTHQANVRIIAALARAIGAPDAIVATDVAESGNTSAASIPLALSKLLRRREITAGQAVLLFGFGAGLTYAGQVVTCP